MYVKPRFLLILSVLSFIALLVRLAVSYELSGVDMSITMPHPSTDMATYKDLSEKIIKGEFKGPFYYQPFYYAVFLPVISIVFGKSIGIFFMIQSALGALIVLTAGIISKRLFGDKAGIATALLLTFSTVMIVYTPYMLIEILFAFWVILLLYFLLRAVDKPNALNCCMTGFLTGLAILTRGNAWFLLPGVIAIIAWPYIREFIQEKSKKTILRLLRPSLLIIIFVFLPQLPFMYHNSALAGKLSGPSTASGAVLALGNTPEAPPGGRNPGTGPGPMEYPPTFTLWMDKEAEISIPSRILAWFKSEPAAFIELSFRKMLLFWDSREIPNNIEVQTCESKSFLLRIFGFIPTALIIIMALAGCFVFFRKSCEDRRISALFYFLLSLWLAISAFYILCRFRVVTIPLMAIFAGGFFSLVYEEVEKKNYRKLLGTCALPLAAGLFICVVSYDFYRYNMETFVMKFARPSGVSVSISANEQMLLDNGPFTFGGWVFYEIEKDSILTKKFIRQQDKDFSKAKFELSLFWMNPGKTEIEINGVKFPVSSAKAGPVQHSIDLPFPSDSTFEIKFPSPVKGIFYALDFQRDYGRTAVNGKSVGAELVCRLFCIKEVAKQAF